jgi:hypothetical protein
MINFSFVVVVVVCANIPGLRIDISPMRNQKANNVCVPSRGGLHERRAVPLHTSVFHVGPHGKENLGKLVVTGTASKAEKGFSVLSGLVH